MNIRPKTVRRLSVLFAGLLVCIAVVALLLVRSLRRERASIAGTRRAAFEALERHDDAAAVALFERYINRSPAEGGDAEAVYAYAIAREHVPMEGHRQVSEAIALLQRYLDLAPADPKDASHELLKLYGQARYSKEALTLADKLLAKNPHDVAALRARAVALITDRKPAEALAACHALNQADPANLFWEEQELRLMSEQRQPADQVVAHARQLHDAHPQDPRFDAVLALALDMTGDHAGAAAALAAAAALPPADAESALQIIVLLDALPRVDLSDSLLARAASRFPGDAPLQELSIRRIFEREEYGPLIEKLKGLNPAASPAASSNVLGYDATALYQVNRRADADAVVKALAARSDGASQAWAGALRARYPAQPIEPAAVIKACRDAIALDRTNAVFPCFLGDAHAQLGETDEALRDWNTAANLSRTWPLPLYRMSRTLSSTGRYPEALRVAAALLRRAPGAVAGQVAYAIAAWGRMRHNPAEIRGDEGQKLLRNLEMIRSRIPNEPDTLPAYAALLGEQGQRDRAIEAVRLAIAAPVPPPEATFGQLLAVDREEHLGLEQELLDRDEKSHGLTPAIAFDRALTLYNAGKKRQAVELLSTLRQSHANDPAWQLDDARYRDATGDPSALDAWKALCAAHADDVRVQYAALGSPARFADRTFWQQTIDRVKALTGPDGQAWQIEQARLRLSGRVSPPELEQTIASLQTVAQASPELGDVRRLLAQALLRTGKPESLDKATAELTAAHDLAPDDFPTTSELARLFTSRGMPERAASLVDGVARTTNLAPEQRLWAARMYGDLGNPEAGIRLLTQGGDDDQRLAGRDALLAHLYLRAGRTDDARQVYTRLVDAPAATPADLIQAADFFASSAQPDKADRCLARLKEMKLDEGWADVLHALVQEREGRPDEAARTLTEATRVRPQTEQAWLELAGLHLRGGRLDEADKIAAAGLQAIPNAPALTAMRSQIARLQGLDRGDVLPLLPTISRDPRQPAAEATIAALADARAHNASPRDLLAALRQVADRYPAFLPLQQIVANRYAAARQYKEASDVASRACEAAPGDPGPLQLLSDVQARAGDFVGARATAGRWRAASSGQPLPADLMIALTYLEQPDADPAAAIRQLESYMSDSAPEPQRLGATLLYCRALLAAGRIDDAAARLQPLIPKSPQWIATWVNLATTGAKDAAAAAQWLRRLEPLLPADSPQLRIALAQAWQRVGMRFGSTAADETARGMLEPIVAHPPVVAPAWEAWALAQQSLGNFAEAEHGWNEFLKLDSNNASAKNNLAFVLSLEGGAARLARAESLAREAIAAAPDASTFYDTLARIEGQAGHPADAVSHFRVAIEKDPGDVEAMVGLADALRSQPAGRDEARALLTRINALLTGGTTLLPPIQKQLDRVRTSLSSTITAPE